jgi:uncharacterized membrane protein
VGERWEKLLDRWAGAGLMDAGVADRIRAWEAEQEKSGGLRWPVLLAVSFGGILLGAGVLLFVAAHWDDLSPASRFSLVLLMVAVFHVAGALFAEKFAALATAMHAVGTIALGAGIFLSGQIFNLQEHWPGGVMLWAAGAWIAWALLRDWTQAALAALLTPAWLGGEWIVATERMGGANVILAQGLFLLAIVYLTAQLPAPGDSGQAQQNYTRRAMFILGGLALVPCTIFLISSMDESVWRYSYGFPLPTALAATGYALALGLPIAVGYWLRGRDAWTYPVAGLWVAVLATLDPDQKYQVLAMLLWCAVGGAALTAWGVRDSRREIERFGLLGVFASVVGLLVWAHEEKTLWIYPLCMAMAVGVVAWGVRVAKKDAINIGVVVFAVTVGFFYFSTVMDKLGRSASLIGTGLLFLAGGWFLETTRRRLVARVTGGG